MTLTRLRIVLRSLLYLISLVTLTTTSGCNYLPQEGLADSDRHAKAAKQDSFGDSAERVVYPEQNWSDSDSQWFYTTSQGSNLIPYTLFLHLEVAESNALFRADANMNRLRYLPQKASTENPDGLPVGWVKDEYEGREYIGLNCAACHTSQINYQGAAIRIEGGATLADMDLMLKSLSKALEASLEQPDKFERLAQQVLREKYPVHVEAFRAELVEIAQKIAHYNQVNDSRYGDQTIAYGYGRLDAFGRIYNRILAHLTPGQANFNTANGPVSYPHLWDTPQHDFVQWNGVGDNEANGPLDRNVGEALGVFSHFDLNKKQGDVGFKSSVKLNNLMQMEQRLESLWSPSWEQLARQKILPPINKSLAELGQQVFIEYQCNTCHKTIDRTDPNRRVIAQLSSLPVIGTDPVVAMNALKHSGKMGFFTGELMNPHNPNSPRFQATGAVLPALSAAVAGVVAESKSHQKGQLTPDKNPVEKTELHVDFEIVDKNNPATLLAYKARPLNGIWATAPYLHNGSVPSLYELFMPSCSDAEIASGKICRPNRFTVGTRELDATNVGLVQRDPARFPGLFVFETSLPSNSNKGHEYAAGVTPVFVLDAEGRPVKDAQGKPKMQTLQPISSHQRLALVEYLKTL